MTAISIDHLERVLDRLCCPACLHGETRCSAGDLSIHQETGLSVQCRTCGAQYPVVKGVIDFLPDYEENAAPGLAQRSMENRFVVNYYEKYFRPAFTRLGSPITYNQEIQWLKSVLPDKPVQYLIDLACGTGKYTRILHDHLSPDWIFAIDISMPMLQQAVEMAALHGASDIIHIRADAAALPLRDQCINGLNCFGALHLFPDTVKTISEISRISADNAFFTCLTARKLRLWRPIQILFSRLFSFHFFDEAGLENLLISNGFQDFRKSVSRMVLMFACTKQ
ncbi:MAG: methyltransferase domain-containing protein [Thermodesulfobacteriota bacterium]|nr:methyltransferase domain-containing protein [Thermodesulfobacteriota bacterium]